MAAGEKGRKALVASPTPIAVEEARAQLGELLNRVGYGREEFVITRHGKPVARLVPVDAVVAA